MALLGTLIDTQTVAIASTASATITHSIGSVPDCVIMMPSYSTVSVATTLPYWSVSMGSASVTFFNRGNANETWTAVTVRFHSIVR